MTVRPVGAQFDMDGANSRGCFSQRCIRDVQTLSF